MRRYTIEENNINIVFDVNSENEVKLLHFSCLPFSDKDITSSDGTQAFRPLELMISGFDKPGERQGVKYIQTGPGYRLKFLNLLDYKNHVGRKIELLTCDPTTNINVESHYQFFGNLPIVKCWTVVKNNSHQKYTLEYVSSFAITGIEKEGLLNPEKKLELWIPHNSWQREINWKKYKFSELGISEVQPRETRHSSNKIGVGNTGNWSTKEYLPLAVLRNIETNSSLFWQIEHNGSWYWEISDQDGHYYLKLSGPSEIYDHWTKTLEPGDNFISVPVSVGSCIGHFDDVFSVLTKYRRKIRRPNRDNIELPIIFNDYMNCLFGNPTEEIEIKLIDLAASLGCEYYCIDCGWYAENEWWDEVGEWLPSKKRFPSGLVKLMDYIRDKGMIPGLWLEIEVVGIHSPIVKKLPDDWFFVRHNKRVYDRSRFQLDFRNPEVRTFADEIIDRLVCEYKVGYIKMDYNIEPGIGTELNADSFGDGLLQHERAYLQWLDSLFDKYPDLVIENCSSGGLRMDYAMLSRHSIQSTSDQENYIMNSTIAVNAPSALTPEQAAVWSYPLASSNLETVAFNVINSILLRVHQSGQIDQLTIEGFNLLREGLTYYKSIRKDIRKSVPYWPVSISYFEDPWACLGERIPHENKEYLAVFRRNSLNDTLLIPLVHLKNKDIEVKCAYPKSFKCSLKWNKWSGMLSVSLPEKISARLIEISY